MFKDKKKIIILALLVVIVAVIVIIVISSLGNKKVGYDELETKLVGAAKIYYNTNSKLLPKEDGDETSVTIKKLVDREYIKPIENLTENGEKCDGKVVVKNVDGKYSYIPYLHCGKYYKTTELYDKILDDNPTVTENVGLYVMDDNYTFRGEVDNNYLKVRDNLWKIMGLNSDETIKIIYAGKAERSVYDDRYNTEKESNYGKNDYKISRIYENLNTFLNNEDIFSTDFKAQLVKMNACIGSRDVAEENNSMQVECSSTLDNQYATLITVSEYLNASLDKGCKISKNNECQNYNYLSRFEDDSNWWTITPDSTNTYKAYQISNYGVISLNSCYSLGGIRPIVYLSNATLYRGGDGTADDPYIIFSEDKLVEEN